MPIVNVFQGLRDSWKQSSIGNGLMSPVLAISPSSTKGAPYLHASSTTAAKTGSPLIPRRISTESRHQRVHEARERYQEGSSGSRGSGGGVPPLSHTSTVSNTTSSPSSSIMTTCTATHASNVANPPTMHAHATIKHRSLLNYVDQHVFANDTRLATPPTTTSMISTTQMTQNMGTIPRRKKSAPELDTMRLPPPSPGAVVPSASLAFKITTTLKGNRQLRWRLKHLYDYSEWPCVLVQDAIDHDRLVSQHYLLRSVFAGADFHAPVHAALKDTPDGLVVIDIGCGRGHWTMEMATAFPNSTFIGIDQHIVYPKDIKPRNCHFRQADIRQFPLPFPNDSVDYIFQRDMNMSLHQDDWSMLIAEYHRILKPGGWIELMEPDLETKSSLEKECVMNDHLLRALSARGQDPYVGRRLPILLANHGFRRVESHFQSLPLAWDHDDEYDHRQKRHGQAMASQYLFYLRSLGPWLRLVMGLSLAKYVEYVNQLPHEWQQAQTYVNWHCATSQKPLQ